MITAVAPVKGSKPHKRKNGRAYPKDKIMAVMDEINSADFQHAHTYRRYAYRRCRLNRG